MNKFKLGMPTNWVLCNWVSRYLLGIKLRKGDSKTTAHHSSKLIVSTSTRAVPFL